MRLFFLVSCISCCLFGEHEWNSTANGTRGARDRRGELRLGNGDQRGCSEDEYVCVRFFFVTLSFTLPISLFLMASIECIFVFVFAWFQCSLLRPLVILRSRTLTKRENDRQKIKQGQRELDTSDRASGGKRPRGLKHRWAISVNQLILNTIIKSTISCPHQVYC